MDSAAEGNERISTCVVCQDDFDSAAAFICECDHEYCRSCLTQLVENALHDESRFPPRCCQQPILLDSKPGFLAAQLVRELDAKNEEYNTPNRTYCHRQYCSRFIPARAISGSVGTCIRCEMKTCVNCKNAEHESDCPENLAEQEILRVAQENAWSQCPWCHAVVEKEQGCNHMTCRCGAEFCYLCNTEWPDCDCEGLPYEEEDDDDTSSSDTSSSDEDEDEDMDDAEPAQQHHGQNNEGQNRHAGGALAFDHRWQPCQHEVWQNVRGINRCEDCGMVMRFFISVCTGCSMMLCRNCRDWRVEGWE